MPMIATDAKTVGDVVESTVQALLNGLYSERGSYPRKIDKERNAAARVAIENLKRDLLEVWCPDRDTQLKDLEVPQR